jgi:hypothetical protein
LALINACIEHGYHAVLMHPFTAVEQPRNATTVLMAHENGVLEKDRAAGLWTPFPTRVSQPPGPRYHLCGKLGRLSIDHWPVATLRRCLSRLAVALSDEKVSAPTTTASSVAFLS